MPAKYLQIANRIASRIKVGELQSGNRLPSLRELCRLEKISLMTALSVYSYLEEKGLIVSRVRSGFFVCPPRSPIVSHPSFDNLSFSGEDDHAAIIQAIMQCNNDADYFSFGAGLVESSLLPVRQLQRIGKRILLDSPDSLVRYSAPPGLFSLRNLLASRLNDRGCMLKPGNFILTNGCMEALHLVSSHLVKPGGRVLVEGPTFYSLFSLFNALGVEIIEAPVHPQQGLLPETLLSYLRRYKPDLVVLIPNFHNPTGALIPEENKRAIVEIIERHGVPCVEDDIYAELSHLEDRPRPLLAYSSQSLFWLASSVSKCLTPGVRIGFVASMASVEPLCQKKTFLSGSNVTTSEKLVAMYFESGFFDRHRRRFSRILQANIHAFQRVILESFPHGTKVADPHGGFFLWVELPEGLSGTRLFHECMQNRIVISPGAIFSGTDCFRNFIRLNCGVEWNSKAENSLRIVGKLAGKLTQEF